LWWKSIRLAICCAITVAHAVHHGGKQGGQITMKRRRGMQKAGEKNNMTFIKVYFLMASVAQIYSQQKARY
jgi:hypothetical protein